MTNTSYFSLCVSFVLILHQISMCTWSSGWYCCLLSM